MSLADLKKKAAAQTRKKIDVDDFIEDATAYAQGQSILSQTKQVQSKPSQQKRKKNARPRKFKNATFTLSPEHIEQLNHLAEHTGFAKSRILRLLIEQIADLDDDNIDALLASLNKPTHLKPE
ncbi:hypothetical protein PULV_b0498 [Pseudoalteromonas ulvae UL12]|uniref:replication protein RepA n=1 Tax=Pseudoalteromonas ulvae TaxID=107327 RepID=UPI00186B8073|nr:replication protein RepA [Pseudoalteromonas ulvae]MBE0365826.1 hypothetical protein [Pseudoalteromonas ulvae UL12]